MKVGGILDNPSPRPLDAFVCSFAVLAGGDADTTVGGTQERIRHETGDAPDNLLYFLAAVFDPVDEIFGAGAGIGSDDRMHG